MGEILKIEKSEAGSLLELKPCPFCGNKEIVYMQYQHDAGLRWKVFCLGCAAEIDPGYAQDKCVVRDKWNRRV